MGFRHSGGKRGVDHAGRSLSADRSDGKVHVLQSEGVSRHLLQRKSLRRELLKGELVIVPNVGHLPNLEDPMAFNEALLAFLNAG